MAIEKKDLNNAFAKHLNIFHPDAEGDKQAFNMKVLQTFSKPLERKVTEAVLINNSKANIKMNSRVPPARHPESHHHKGTPWTRT